MQRRLQFNIPKGFFEDDKGEAISIPICIKTVCVDGEIIKEDTFYKLENGEFVEVEEEE